MYEGWRHVVVIDFDHHKLGKPIQRFDLHHFHQTLDSNEEKSLMCELRERERPIPVALEVHTLSPVQQHSLELEQTEVWQVE